MTLSPTKHAMVGALCVLLATVSAADEGSGPQVASLPKYRQECSACHMAYPPGMLPSASWHRLMGNLGKHYGTDASLDEASVREISVWLNGNAGTYRRVSEEPPQDRITQSVWFLRKHNAREVPPDAWKRASVGSASNCAACHANAAKGNFNEREVRIPSK